MYCMVLNKLFGIYIDDKNGLSACIDIYLSSMYMKKACSILPSERVPAKLYRSSHAYCECDCDYGCDQVDIVSLESVTWRSLKLAIPKMPTKHIECTWKITLQTWPKKSHTHRQRLRTGSRVCMKTHLPAAVETLIRFDGPKDHPDESQARKKSNRTQH